MRRTCLQHHCDSGPHVVPSNRLRPTCLPVKQLPPRGTLGNINVCPAECWIGEIRQWAIESKSPNSQILNAICRTLKYGRY
jgi:hypothetical protein